MRKITAIRDDLLCSSTGDLCSIAMKADNIFSGEKLQVFHPASDREIKELIFNSPNKSCDFDPLPTWLLKKCIDPLLQPVTAIVNRSLAEGVMPSSLKCAAVTPLLKKAGMDEEDMSSYRPISNLPFLSKLIEKVVARNNEWTGSGVPQ